jgi:hypothetical protein
MLLSVLGQIGSSSLAMPASYEHKVIKPHLVRSTFGSCRGDAIERHSGCGPHFQTIRNWLKFLELSYTPRPC